MLLCLVWQKWVPRNLQPFLLPELKVGYSNVPIPIQLKRKCIGSTVLSAKSRLTLVSSTCLLFQAWLQL